jgi:alpha,alpha-trehalase
MKPFLSQGVYFASVKLNDFSWIEPHYDALMKVFEYRDKTQLNSTYNCYFWENAGQSGADNNPAMNYWRDDTRFIPLIQNLAIVHFPRKTLIIITKI